MSKSRITCTVVYGMFWRVHFFQKPDLKVHKTFVVLGRTKCFSVPWSDVLLAFADDHFAGHEVAIGKV